MKIVHKFVFFTYYVVGFVHYNGYVILRSSVILVLYYDIHALTTRVLQIMELVLLNFIIPNCRTKRVPNEHLVAGRLSQVIR